MTVPLNSSLHATRIFVIVLLSIIALHGKEARASILEVFPDGEDEGEGIGAIRIDGGGIVLEGIFNGVPIKAVPAITPMNFSF